MADGGVRRPWSGEPFTAKGSIVDCPDRAISDCFGSPTVQEGLRVLIGIDLRVQGAELLWEDISSP